MKKIEAIIKPFKLDDIRRALSEIGVDRLTVIEVKNTSRPGIPELYRGALYSGGFLGGLKIEATVPNALLDPAVKAILRVTKSGKPDEGEMLVLPVERGVALATGLPLEPDTSTARTGAASRAAHLRNPKPDA